MSIRTPIQNSLCHTAVNICFRCLCGAAKCNLPHFAITAHSCKAAWVDDKLALIRILILDVSAA